MYMKLVLVCMFLDYGGFSYFVKWLRSNLARANLHRLGFASSLSWLSRAMLDCSLFLSSTLPAGR